MALFFQRSVCIEPFVLSIKSLLSIYIYIYISLRINVTMGDMESQGHFMRVWCFELG